MCIRDRLIGYPIITLGETRGDLRSTIAFLRSLEEMLIEACLLYTSDAADERSSVDLGGRRIIKKKKDVDTNGIVRATL